MKSDLPSPGEREVPVPGQELPVGAEGQDAPVEAPRLFVPHGRGDMAGEPLPDSVEDIAVDRVFRKLEDDGFTGGHPEVHGEDAEKSDCIFMDIPPFPVFRPYCTWPVSGIERLSGLCNNLAEL